MPEYTFEIDDVHYEWVVEYAERHNMTVDEVVNEAVWCYFFEHWVPKDD